MLLLNIATHTRLMHIVAWMLLVGCVLVAAFTASNASGGPGGVIVVLLLGGLLIAAVAYGSKRPTSAAEAPTE